MKRALVFIGAGASLDFGIAGTAAATQEVERAVLFDDVMKYVKGDQAYTKIVETLSDYLGGRDQVNFEQIVHCAHELTYTFPPTSGAVKEFRPILFPFVRNDLDISVDALKPLTNLMLKTLYGLFADGCAAPTASLEPLSQFLDTIGATYRTRVYTTNYDDLILQAKGQLYCGYDRNAGVTPRKFDAAQFWNSEDLDCVFHLHGSVHLGFADPGHGGDLGELCWYDDREDARKRSTFSGGLSRTRRMDGSSYNPTAIVSGLDKTSSLQQSPFLHFYAALGRDAIKADVIFVIGSGLTDLHINAWLNEARNRESAPPLVFVDFWSRGLPRVVAFQDTTRKEIEMVHSLRMPLFDDTYLQQLGSHWSITKDRSAAIWDNGFGSFLADPNGLAEAMREIGATI